MMNRVSVHIVTYNSATDIENCLEAVFQQNYPMEQILVIDNASSDSTVDILEEYLYQGKIHLVKNEINNGFAGAHNQALSMTTSEFVLILNPDVTLHQDYLYHLIKRMNEKPKVGSITGKLFYERTDIMDSTGLLIYRSRRAFERGTGEKDLGQYDQHKEIFGVSGAAALYRREMIQDISIDEEFFDETFFAYKEDVDVAWRARLFGWEAEFVPQAVGFHKRGWGSERKRQAIPLKLRKLSYMNRYFMMLKNESFFWILVHLPYILWFELLSNGYLLLREPKVLLAWKDIFKSVPTMLHRRNEIQARMRKNFREIYRFFRS